MDGGKDAVSSATTYTADAVIGTSIMDCNFELEDLVDYVPRPGGQTLKRYKKLIDDEKIELSKDYKYLLEICIAVTGKMRDFPKSLIKKFPGNFTMVILDLLLIPLIF